MDGNAANTNSAGGTNDINRGAARSTTRHDLQRDAPLFANFDDPAADSVDDTEASVAPGDSGGFWIARMASAATRSRPSPWGSDQNGLDTQSR